jgi:hypothetical protein
MAQNATIFLSAEAVARYAYQAGLKDPSNLTIAVAVARAESGTSGGIGQNAISLSNDYGIWQINRPAHSSQYDFDRLLSDAAYNAKAMMDISGGGKNFTPWSTWSPDFSQAKAGTGPAKNYINDARTTVANVLGLNLATQPIAATATTDTSQLAQSDYRYSREFVESRQQAQFDPRHRRVGTRSALMDIFAGPTFWGAIVPIQTDLGGGFSVSSPTKNTPYIYTGTVREGSLRGDVSRVSPFSLFFQFNPAEITFQYSGNPNILPIGSLDESQTNPQIPMADSNTIISFDLFFDRTYEVINGSDIGVLTDIRCLEQICGISEDRPVMILSPVTVLLGTPNAFQFNGIIQSFSVDYTHFSHDMVPMRCTVSVNMNRISSNIFASKDDVKTYSGDDWQTKAAKNSSSSSSSSDNNFTGILPDDPTISGDLGTMTLP